MHEMEPEQVGRCHDGHDGAGIAGRDEALNFAPAQQPGCLVNRRVPLASDSYRDRLVHTDGLLGMDDVDACW